MSIDKRLRIWSHNALQGHLTRAQTFIMSLQKMDSVSPEAKQIAQQIQSLLYDLRIQLKKRID